MPNEIHAPQHTEKKKTLTSGDDVVVLCKPARAPRAQPPLREERDSKVGRVRRVDPDAEPSGVVPAKCVSMHASRPRWPQRFSFVHVRDDGCVQVIRAELWPVPVHGPEGKWHDESEHVRPRNPLVSLAAGEKLVAKAAPYDCLGVVRLRLLARPDISALNGQQDLTLVVDDRIHHHYISHCH